MKATFLGHGLNSGNNNNVGKQLAKSFESKYFDIFIGFVAFAAVSGIDTILEKIKKAKSKYKNIRFYIGVDNKGTSKEALELLIKEDIETYIYHKREKYITYHPKLFVFEGDKFSRVIVGSSNLTSSGFKSNIESSIQLDFRTDTDKQGLKLLNEIKEYYGGLINLTDKNLYKLDTELIKEFEVKNLLYSQFQNGSGKEETQPTDGENDENDIDKIKIPEFEINGGFEPEENKPRNRNVKFSPTDYENFEILFERYKVYKRDIRSSGVVNKDTDDRELFNWYRRIKDLIGDGELPEELMQRLIEIDFPIGDGWEKTRLMLWDKRFETLLEYKSKFNPNSQITHVPQFRDKKNPYFPLGSWCATQKQRRKGNCTPIWTEYEEKKMESIHFLWEILDIKGRTNDDDWADHLVELEEYYAVSKNFKTIPHQNTRLGKWLNEQLTTKLTGTRGKVKKFLNPLREEMLGDLLKRNGVEWEWRKQKQRESIEKSLSFWTELNELEIQSNPKAMTETTRKKISLCKKKIAELNRSSKKWHNARNKWKIEILDKVGFPYSKMI